MEWKLEVIVLPVSDVDAAKEFYVDKLGFVLDVDHVDGDFRVVQTTPAGSGCSVSFGTGVSPASPGSLSGLQLTVADIHEAFAHLQAAEVDCGPGIQHFENGQAQPGPDPAGAEFNSFLFFADPDGNQWAVQQGRR